MVVPYSTTNAAGFNFNEVFTPAATGARDSWRTIPPVPVGTIADGTDGSKWVYVKVGTGAVTGLGYVGVVDEDFLAVMMSNSVGALGDKVVVFPAAALLGDYMWAQMFGTCDAIQVAASTNPNVPLASTVTAGQISATVTTPTKNLTGIWLTTARGGTAGTAPGYLNWPTVGTTN